MKLIKIFKKKNQKECEKRTPEFELEEYTEDHLAIDHNHISKIIITKIALKMASLITINILVCFFWALGWLILTKLECKLGDNEDKCEFRGYYKKLSNND